MTKYVSPQQEMEELAASLTHFFEKAVTGHWKSKPGQKEFLTYKKSQAERLQVLLKQNGREIPGSH